MMRCVVRMAEEPNKIKSKDLILRELGKRTCRMRVSGAFEIDLSISVSVINSNLGVLQSMEINVRRSGGLPVCNASSKILKVIMWPIPCNPEHR